ncbi:DUF3035 domain-containing protein [Candidatus Pelagibacter sp. HIMB1517]|uniref:DUF3035 domain-containing protein n=1 Tax=Candidatus Pelagibacter sp. HIMB1517 TaxID=3413341 RepID=UPI003F8402B0
MKKFIISTILLFFANSCESLKKGLGLEKDPPDEFLVIKNKPIQVPPDFDLLPPGSKQVEVKKDQTNNAKNIVDKNLAADQNTKNDKIEQSQGADIIEKEILKQIGN